MENGTCILRSAVSGETRVGRVECLLKRMYSSLRGVFRRFGGLADVRRRWSRCTARTVVGNMSDRASRLRKVEESGHRDLGVSIESIRDDRCGRLVVLWTKLDELRGVSDTKKILANRILY